MKSTNFSQSYFSTSQAARMLGLSVGTVQRMVETGVFKAFVTQGGHRRILSSSLQQFCKAQGFASPQVAHDVPLICILHASDKVNSTLTQLNQWTDVKVITQPLDLMGLHRTIGALFIDARIAWVHGSPMHLHDTAARDAHIVIYNSAQLPPASALYAANHVSLFEGDISTDLVFGYLLGNSRGQNLSEIRTDKQHAMNLDDGAVKQAHVQVKRPLTKPGTTAHKHPSS
jgi:excisionase family DNA binding protein